MKTLSRSQLQLNVTAEQAKRARVAQQERCRSKSPADRPGGSLWLDDLAYFVIHAAAIYP